MINLSKLGRPHPLLLLTLCYAIIGVILYSTYGVRVVNDTARYLAYADALTKGFYFEEHNGWYLGYVLFLYLVKLCGGGLREAVLLQYLMSYLAVITLYKAHRYIFPSGKGALLSGLLYILFVEIMTWNSYLLPESFFSSMISISLYALARMTGPVSRWVYPIVALVVTITIFTKPTGIALLAATGSLFLYEWIRGISRPLLKWTISALVLLLILVLANTMLGSFRIMENYGSGEVVYAIRTLPDKPEYESLKITPPDNLVFPSEDLPPLFKIIYFVAHNPFYWAKLFLLKIFYLIAHIRPYWSWYHNAFVILFLFPCYFFMIKGFIKGQYPGQVVVFGLTYCLIHTVSIGITSVDWDGRFLMPMLPVVFLLSSVGLSSALNKLRYKIMPNLLG